MAKFLLDPIGVVRSPRVEVRDDDWGGLESEIVLDDRFAADALEGIEQFSHAEILFFFDRVDPEKIVAGARPPPDHPRWPALRHLRPPRRGRPDPIRRPNRPIRA